MPWRFLRTGGKKRTGWIIEKIKSRLKRDSHELSLFSLKKSIEFLKNKRFIEPISFYNILKGLP